MYGDGLRASVRVTENGTNSQVAAFEINDSNKFVEYTDRVPQVTDLKVTATGEGCFLFQVTKHSWL